jgi:DNA-binding beta-propeller fold protein YncE
VTVHDAATGAATDTLAVGTNPQCVLVDSTGIVNVLCTGDYAASFGRVFFIDPSVPAVIDSLEIGGSPGFACLGDSGRVYVTGWMEGLLVYDAARRAVIRGAGDPLLADIGLQGMAFDGVERRLYIADFDDDAVRVVSLESGALERSFAAGDGPVGCAVYRP